MRPWLVLLLIAPLLAGCTSADNDRDDDGLTNLEETTGWTIRVEFADIIRSYHVTSDPDKSDTDGDGLLDHFEFALGLDPRSADTDQDGLTDCQEVRHTVRAECESDEWEGTTDGGYKTLANDADSDPRVTRYTRERPILDEATGEMVVVQGDGILDGEEVAGYRISVLGRERTVQTDPLLIDSDGDHLEDGEERYLYNSDPLVSDTDGDQCIDGLDPIPEADERLRLGLQSVTWAPEGRSGSQDVQLLLHLADNGFNHPADRGITLRHGEAHDLTGAGLPSFKQAFCTFPPWHPWVRVSVQAREINDGVPGWGLDLFSHDVPNDAGIVWWNVRTGDFNFDAESLGRHDPSTDFRPPAGQFVWSGIDGSVTFAPSLVKQGNQNA